MVNLGKGPHVNHELQNTQDTVMEMATLNIMEIEGERQQGSQFLQVDI